MPATAVPSWVPKLLLAVFMVAGGVVALSFRPLYAPRAAQHEASRYLLAREPLQAWKVADAQLQRTPDDRQLQAIAEGAAEVYVDGLVAQGKRDEARTWLAGQMEARPYLRRLAPKLAELRR